jgi:hypothetical protein
MKKRFLEIIGAIMSVIGFIDAIPFGSIAINESSQQEINPTDAYPKKPIYGIISPLYAKMVFIITGSVGVAVIVLQYCARRIETTTATSA